MCTQITSAKKKVSRKTTAASCCFRARHQSLWVCEWSDRNWDSAFISCLTLSPASSFLCPLFLPSSSADFLLLLLLHVLLFFNLLPLTSDWIQLWHRKYWNGPAAITYHQILLLSWKSAAIAAARAVEVKWFDWAVIWFNFYGFSATWNPPPPPPKKKSSSRVFRQNTRWILKQAWLPTASH